MTEPLPELAGERARSATRSCATRTSSIYFRQYGDATASAPTATIRCRSRPRRSPRHGLHPRDARLHPASTSRAAREDAAAAPRPARRAAGPAFNGLFSFTPDGSPSWASRRIARLLGGRGGLDHARGRRGPGDGRVDGRRRAEHRPARVRPESLPRPRALGRAFARAPTSSTSRSTTSSTRSSRCARPREPPPQPFPPRQDAGRRVLRERGLGAPAVVSRPTSACCATRLRREPTAAWSAAALVARSAVPSTWRPARGWRFRPHPVHEAGGHAAPARWPSSSASPPTRSIGRSAGRLHCAAHRRGGISCDLTVTRLAEEASSSSPAARSASTTSPGCAATCPATARSTLTDETSASAASGCGDRAPATSSARSTEDDIRDEAFPYLTMRELHVGSSRSWRCASPTSASSAGRSTRRRSTASRCGTRSGRPGDRTASSPLRRRGLRLAAPGEGLPPLGGRHRRGVRPLGGRPRLRGEARQGRLPRPRRPPRARRTRCVARKLCCLTFDDPRSCSWARSRSSTPTGQRARLRHERGLRLDRRREHRLRLPAGRRTPSPGRASASGATAP